MAKYTGWVGKRGGGGYAVDTDGTIRELNEKPPETEFVPKPAGAPAGDFIQTPNKAFKMGPDGNYVPIEGSDFAEMGRPGARTARTEFFGEIQDRRNEQEKAMALKLATRMEAKGQLDTEGMRPGYTPAQEQRKQALRDSRAKLEAEFAEYKHTPEQMKQFEEQITLQEQAILPQLIRQPPTPMEQFMGNQIVDPVTGVRLYSDGKGKWIEVPGQPDQATRLKYWELAQKPIMEPDGKGGYIEKMRSVEEQQQYVAAMLGTTMAIGGITGGAPGVEPGTPGVRPQLREDPREQQAKKVFNQLGLSAEVIRKAVEAEGSYGAALQKFIDSMEKDQKNPKGQLTKDQFMKTARKSPGTMPTDRGFRQLSGAGGAGGGRF